MTPLDQVDAGKAPVERLEIATGLERRLGLGLVLGALGYDGVTRMGRYVVEHKVGEGAMGAVYRARDPELDRVVAIKVLRDEVGSVDRQGKLEEARALARLSHPNVLPVYDVGEIDGSPYIVTEFVDGMDLRAWVRYHADASWREVTELLVQAGRGLAAIHAAGVVHRDVKATNLLVGSDGRVRVADLGLALRDPSEDEPQDLAGTPRYMAPEVREGRAAVAASDQFSFCRSAWELMGLDRMAGAAEPHAAVVHVLERGLRNAPDQRWPSMEELVAALEEVTLRGRERQLEVLQQRVERQWLDGFMRQALGERTAVALPLSEVPELVDSPWDHGRGETPGRRADTTELVRLLDEAHDALLLVGNPGAGKTMALLMVAETLLRRARRDPGHPTPVVLNLSSHDAERGSLEDWLVREIATKYSVARGRVRHWIETHSVALLLDGLDEVEPARRGRTLQAINEFRSRHAAPTVVTCRESDARALPGRLALGAAWRVEPLDAAGVEQFLAGFGAAGEDLGRRLQGSDVPVEMRTPLMLTILAVGGGPGLERGGGGDSIEWGSVYRRYVARMLARDPEPVRSRTLERLRWLARAMEREQVSDLWLERLQARWLGGAARWLGLGLGISFVVVAVLITNLAANLASGRGVWSGIIMGVSSVVVVFLFIGGFRVRPVEALRWSWRRAALFGALATALGLIMGVIYGHYFNGVYDVVIGGVGGLITALLIGVEGSDRESRVRPNQGIVQSWINAGIFGLLGTLLAGLTLGVVAGLILPLAPPGSPATLEAHPGRAVAFICGGFMGIGMFMVMGGAAALLHAGIRVALALTTPLPLRLVPFLDHAASRGLLRRVGGGYIFVHKTLREHLAGEG